MPEAGENYNEGRKKSRSRSRPATADDSDAPVYKRRRRVRRPMNHINIGVKYTLFIFNAIFWLAGIVAICLSIWLFVEKRSPGISLFDPALFVLIPGIIIFLVSFSGCVGALRDNIILLKIYVGLLVTLLLVEGIAGMYLLLVYFVPEVRESAGYLVPKSSLEDALRKYMDPDYADLNDLVDSIQADLQCCGLEKENGHKDWNLNPYYNCTDNNPSRWSCAVPPSCCRVFKHKLKNDACGYNMLQFSESTVRKEIYTTGCIDAMLNWLRNNTMMIDLVILAIMVLQVIVCFLARMYIGQIQRQIAQWQW